MQRKKAVNAQKKDRKCSLDYKSKKKIRIINIDIRRELGIEPCL